jgi:hypothetical protein
MKESQNLALSRFKLIRRFTGIPALAIRPGSDAIGKRLRHSNYLAMKIVQRSLIVSIGQSLRSAFSVVFKQPNKMRSYRATVRLSMDQQNRTKKRQSKANQQVARKWVQ